MQKILIIFILGLLVGCNNNAILEGTFTQVPDSLKIQLIELIHKNPVLIDTQKTQYPKQFSFKIPFNQEDTLPKYCGLKIGDKQIVLLIRPKEKIKISGTWNNIARYEVQGSQGSTKIMLHNRKIDSINQCVDSLLKLSLSESTNKRELTSSINRLYIKQKQICTRFIVENIQNYEALVGVFQKFGNGIPLFQDFRDIILLRELQTSLTKNYPQSPYIRYLSERVSQIEQQERLLAFEQRLSELPVLEFPEIHLPDIKGEKQRLSLLKGKTIIVGFWANTPLSRIQNREFIQLKKKYKDIAIYQVFLDEDKNTWESLLKETPLPGTQVIDTLGNRSPLIGNYNLQQLPTYYLIDKTGKIVGKNFGEKELEQKVKSIL